MPQPESPISPSPIIIDGLPLSLSFPVFPDPTSTGNPIVAYVALDNRDKLVTVAEQVALVRKDAAVVVMPVSYWSEIVVYWLRVQEAEKIYLAWEEASNDLESEVTDTD